MTGDLLIEGPLTQEIISEAVAKLGENTGLGGHSVFMGQVRADSKGSRRVAAIEYSAYESMVVREADRIIQSVLSSFEDVRSVRILHSVGRVKAGEISLFVLVSGGHRQQAMEACTMAVELIKSDLPVWKKEIFEDNTHEWQTDSTA
jgi:molybdopterin synthase catalytic subunit